MIFINFIGLIVVVICFVRIGVMIFWGRIKLRCWCIWKMCLRFCRKRLIRVVFVFLVCLMKVSGVWCNGCGFLRIKVCYVWLVFRMNIF